MDEKAKREEELRVARANNAAVAKATELFLAKKINQQELAYLVSVIRKAA